MRILIIEPSKNEVSERIVPCSDREIFSVLGGWSLECTSIVQCDGFNFVLQKYLARTADAFTLFSPDRVFTGRAVICGGESRIFHALKDTTISVAEICKAVNFFPAPRPLYGWLNDEADHKTAETT
jgi:hypothetical protein